MRRMHAGADDSNANLDPIADRGTQHAADAIAAIAKQAPERLIASVSGAPVGAVWAHPAMVADVVGLPHHAVAVHLAGCTLVEKWCGGLLQGHRSRVDSVSLVPAGLSTHWVLAGPARVAHLYIAPQALLASNAQADKPLETAELQDFFGVQDPVLLALVRLMLARASTADAPSAVPTDDLAHDEVMTLATRHLLTRYGLARQRQDEPRRIHLTAATLRRVFEHIESRLADPTALRLHNLAHIARVSEDHFVRAFRASVGQTPHQYLVARRIDTARELLKGSVLPIADVGRAVGFSGASHFSAAFRQRVGVAPAQWRRGVLD